MISIVMPSYNDGELQHRAISSVLSQRDFDDYEIIVVDDGSTVPQDISQYDDPRIRLIRHSENLGLSAALNTGIEASTTEYYCILSADDMFRHDFLVNMSEFFGTVDIISCDFQGDVGKGVMCRGGSLDALKKANCHSYAACVRKSMWEKVGGYKLTMNPSWEDWEFWLNCAKNGATWHHIGKPLHLYHRNPSGRDVDAQTKTKLLEGKMRGYHTDVYGDGTGLVTFVIPCYQHEQFLKEAVDSCFAQIYPHIAVVIVNDASMPSEEFEAVLPEHLRSRVTFIHHKENSHLSASRNSGIYYGLNTLKSDYFVMLDADDSVHPEFVEDTLGDMQERRYVYTHVQFIGDAHHRHNVDSYSCRNLVKKHLHACTFLMDRQMLIDVHTIYGSFYDQNMKEGYEDWEFALRVLKSGWCGKLVKRYLFNYRFHEAGSMRTQATKINAKLTQYVRNVHKWTAGGENSMPKCCGSRGKYTFTSYKQNGDTAMSIQILDIPELGKVQADTALAIRYTGLTTSTMKKMGTSGVIYSYSGNPNGTFGPNFIATAADYHLFVNGPFEIKLFDDLVEEEVQPAASIEQVSVPADITTRELIPEVAETVIEAPVENVTLEVIEQEIYDFTFIKGVGEVAYKKLVNSGYVALTDVTDGNIDNLRAALGCSEAQAATIIDRAMDLL